MRQQASGYANADISFRSWVELIHVLRIDMLARLVARPGVAQDELVADLTALHRWLDDALGVFGQAFVSTNEQVIQRQQQAIRELSTPVLQLRDGLLILPMVGALDAAAAACSCGPSLLEGIRERRARVVVLDVTGVPEIDATAANQLIGAVASARMMGAEVIMTGMSSEIAQTLVSAGIDLEQVVSAGDLQSGIEQAERRCAESRLAAPGGELRRRRLRARREQHGEAGAAARRVGRADAAVVGLDDPGDDRQAEPGARLAALAAALGAPEAVEQRVGVRPPAARGRGRAPARARRRRRAATATSIGVPGGRVDDRVAQQVGEHLAQLVGVAEHRRAGRGVQADRAVGRGRARVVDRVARDRARRRRGRRTGSRSSSRRASASRSSTSTPMRAASSSIRRIALATSSGSRAAPIRNSSA